MQFAISLERCIGTDVFVKTPRRDRHRNGAATPSSTRISAYFFDPTLLFTIHTPRNQIQASSCLSESCPKIGDVPKSPVPPPAALVPSAGTITLRIHLRQCVCHEHPPLMYLRGS